MYTRTKWDNLRFISLLAVVVIHVSALVIINSDNELNLWPLFLNQFSRFSVPAFLVASGYGLIVSKKDKQSYLEYIKGRFNKIGIIFLIASIFYYLVFSKQPFSILSIDGIATILTGNAYYHLYYIVLLFIFYLIFPLLSRMVRRTPKMMLFIFFTLQLVSQFLGIIGIITFYKYNIFNSIFYFVLGIYLAITQQSFKRNIRLFYVLLVVSFILLISFNYIYYSLTHNISLATTTMNPVVTIFATSFIITFLNSNFDFTNYLKADISYYIYLVHPLFISVFSKLIGLLDINIDNVFSFFILLVFVLLSSFLFSWVIKQLMSISTSLLRRARSLVKVKKE
ncbi:acyltransferase [Lapidilactobacillus luobeiensis]|uniref:acyltransferase n=1 Tax=Lapidilactobacillus luobeiensis TaxID=2950371 RepID=UPI0021C49B44|nr:acyltransferase [Lapidilactobacillus luobeiensis]